ncbi:MAG: hypothetical protein WBY44_33915 [Bryobacteraceae bacterium]|jgi:hypothetical protein
MDLNRRGFLLWASAPLLARPLRQHVERARLGEVYFCRVSDARLLPIARAVYPRCIASHEPRPGFHGITFCGAKDTVTVTPDRLS